MSGIPSHPLAFFIVMLSKAHLTSHSKMSGSKWVITPSWLSGSLRSFLYSSSVYYGHLLKPCLSLGLGWKLTFASPVATAEFSKFAGIFSTVTMKIPMAFVIEKAQEFQKDIYFYLIDYAKAFHSVDQNKLWKILKEMGIPGHLTYLLKNLYVGHEALVRTGHGTMDWFKIGKRVRQGCIL